MARRVFTKCLNQELKIFNFSVGSLIGGGILLVLGALSKGLMWGMGAGSRRFHDWALAIKAMVFRTNTAQALLVSAGPENFH